MLPQHLRIFCLTELQGVRYAEDSPLLACLFVTDLHGRIDRYEKLFGLMLSEEPSAVFIGGDLLPSLLAGETEFVSRFVRPRIANLKRKMGEHFPSVFVICGNDDPRREESSLKDGETEGLWSYIHERKVLFDSFPVYGFAYVPPTPFRLKDWERYDVSRYVDPGCVSPEEGVRTVTTEEHAIKWETMQDDLSVLVARDALDHSIFLFHAPPYDTPLDRAELDGKMFEHVPLDVHVGSIAVRRFIEARQPLVTLHGHVHESTRLTGDWKCRIGKTVCINAAHDGPELSVVRFDPNCPDQASRQLI